MSLHSNSNGAYDPLQQNEQNGIPEDGITSQHGDAEASGPDEQMRAAIKELRDVLEALAQRLDGQTTVSSLHSPTKHGLRASTLGRAEILAIVLKWFIQVVSIAKTVSDQGITANS